jgi:hypothetical protein
MVPRTINGETDMGRQQREISEVEMTTEQLARPIRESAVFGSD